MHKANIVHDIPRMVMPQHSTVEYKRINEFLFHSGDYFYGASFTVFVSLKIFA